MLSNIKYINNKYILNLPLIKRQFDNIYMNYKKVNSSFGNFFEGIFFENTIFGISDFGEKKLFYSLDLEKNYEEEFLINKIDFFEIDIFNKKYSILVLFLENGEIKTLSKLEKSDFKIFTHNGILKVKNLELNSVVFKEKLNTVENECISSLQSRIKNISKQNHTGILDIYFFRNFFIKSGNTLTFGEEIDKFIFQNRNLKNKFFPRNILEIFEKGTLKKKRTFNEKIEYFYNSLLNSLSFQEKEATNNTNYYDKLNLLKIFLQFKNNYDFVLDSIYYYDLRDYFKEFSFRKINISAGQQRVSTLGDIDFGKINLEKIDKSLENINKQIQDFTFNYYELEKNYDKINELNNENKNSKILEQNERLKIFKKDLEKIKIEYLKYFKEFLEKITT